MIPLKTSENLTFLTPRFTNYQQKSKSSQFILFSTASNPLIPEKHGTICTFLFINFYKGVHILLWEWSEWSEYYETRIFFNASLKHQSEILLPFAQIITEWTVLQPAFSKVAKFHRPSKFCSRSKKKTYWG